MTVAASIDWPSILSAAGTMIAGLATAALAIYAALGLNAWRKQLRGTRTTELAESILANVYEVEAILEYMIGPFAFGHELDEVERNPDEAEDAWRKRASYSIAHLRYNKQQEPFARLRSLVFRARATFDKETSDAIAELATLPNAVIIQQQRAYRSETRFEQVSRMFESGLATQAQFNQAHAEWERALDDGWLSESDNGLRGRTKVAVKRIEEKLRPHIVAA